METLMILGAAIIVMIVFALVGSGVSFLWDYGVKDREYDEAVSEAKKFISFIGILIFLILLAVIQAFYPKTHILEIFFLGVFGLGIYLWIKNGK